MDMFCWYCKVFDDGDDDNDGDDSDVFDDADDCYNSPAVLPPGELFGISFVSKAVNDDDDEDDNDNDVNGSLFV